MSRWLVIGDSSFTGKNFCRMLNEKGQQFSTASLRDFNPGPGHYDYVVNFAALNVVAPSWAHPEYYARTNIEKSIQTLQAAARYQAKYVYVSTPEVYGSLPFPAAEDEARINPSTPYAASRAGLEMFIHAYAKQYRFPWVITRGCNVFGPGQQLYRFVPKLMATIKKGETFRLEGGGKSQRAWLYVDDMCEGIYTAASKGNGVYHISSEALVSVRELAEHICYEIAKVRASDVLAVSVDRPGKDDIYNLRADRLRRLGWAPQTTVMRGLELTWDWTTMNWETLKDQPMEYTLS